MPRHPSSFSSPNGQATICYHAMSTSESLLTCILRSFSIPTPAFISAHNCLAISLLVVPLLLQLFDHGVGKILHVDLSCWMHKVLVPPPFLLLSLVHDWGEPACRRLTRLWRRKPLPNVGEVRHRRHWSFLSII